MGFKLILLILLILVSCQRKEVDQRPYVGIRIKPLYERELKAWANANKGEIFETRPPLIPSKVFFNNSWYKGQIRIRGDLSRHWRTDSRSYRIKIEDDSIMGMEEFDVIIPSDKGFELEAVAYELSEKMGLITSKYLFIDFQINHKKFNKYFLIERWTKSSFEIRGLKHGAIISENNAWIDSVKMKDVSLYKNVFLKDNLNNELGNYPHIYQGGGNDAPSLLAMTKFSQLLKLDDSTHYIDVEQTAKWMSLLIFLGGEHAILGDNTRWVYDDITQKFSPLIYDVIGVTTRSRWDVCLIDYYSNKNEIVKKISQNKVFRVRVLYWLDWLLNSEENNFERIWNEVSNKFNLNNWTAEEKKERAVIQETVLRNIKILKDLQKNDQCEK